MLSSLGFAGRPFEHFWDPEGAEQEALSSRWPRVLEEGTGDNGVFGVKLLWYQADRLERELPDYLGFPGESLGHVLADALGNPKYIYLTRRDRLRQAISFARARQTNQWRSMDPSITTPCYDRDAITRGLEFLAGEEASWESCFARNSISPYRLTYEELNAAPEDAIRELLTYLGYQGAPRISLPATRHRRQADDMTEEWLRWYRQETAHSP
jgi:LPS sulfotransferase NodH